MHVSRRNCAQKSHARASQEQSWFRLRTRDWDFFVADELEAFAVIARHDVLDVERIGPR